MDVDNLNLTQLIEAVRQAAQNCQCEGTRETIFTARGRDNIVPCLLCESHYKILEHLEAALALLREI